MSQTNNEQSTTNRAEQPMRFPVHCHVCGTVMMRMPLGYPGPEGLALEVKCPKDGCPGMQLTEWTLASEDANDTRDETETEIVM